MKIIIIGAGPGGYETALLAASKGAEVTLFAKGPVGGTCLNAGCIPTKTFCHYAELAETMRKAGDCLDGPVPFVDFAAVAARKEAVVEQLRTSVHTLLEKTPGLNLVECEAFLQPDGSVRAGGEVYEADAVIVATGSYSASLPIPGAGLPCVLDSGQILELKEAPARLCVIGGGVIGLEFASLMRSFGSEVTVLEYAPEVLPRFDADLAKRLRLALGKRGIRIETAARVTSVEEGAIVRYVKKEQEYSIEADTVLMAVGRRPDIEAASLSLSGAECTARGVVVDAHMRTTLPGVYAIGDVTGGYMLAHTATAQGKVAVADIFGEPCGVRLDIVPAAVFTYPEAATVGMTEQECKDAGIAVRCRKSFFRANGKAVSMDEADGYCKMVCREDDDKILGLHMYGAHSADLVQEAAALMTRGCSAHDLSEVIHAHPTLGEVVLAAASV